ncbi:MAG: hypothetical protein GY841_16100 [FCB group bacterium]|nr:hypothetical protein [FCB group bacterium]
MKLSFTDFKGLRPARSPHLLNPDEAQTADDCKLHRGSLRAFDAEDNVYALTGGADVDTIFYYRSGHWLQWGDDVDVVEGPVAGDTTYKLYFTGDGYPKKTRYSDATTGVGSTEGTTSGADEMPKKSYPIESFTPTWTPTLNANNGGGSGDVRQVVYVYTIVTSWGEESGPSPVSAAIDHQDGDEVVMESLKMDRQNSFAYTTDNWIVPGGWGGAGDGNGVYKCIVAGTSSAGDPGSWSDYSEVGTTRVDGTVTWECVEWDIIAVASPSVTIRLYRSNTSSDSAAYQFVKEGSSNTITDDVVDEDLSTVLPSSDYAAPPVDLANITSLGNFFAGTSKKDIYFCEPNLPHAWPVKYRTTIGGTPVAMAGIGHTLVVATNDFPYLIYGSHPGSMSAPQELPEPYPCVSKRSMATWRETALYATTNGVVRIASSGETALITDGYYDKEAWSALLPSSMQGVVYDDKYILFYESSPTSEKGVLSGTYGGLNIDLLTGVITRLTTRTSAAYVEPTSGKLYRVYFFESVLLQESGTPHSSRTNLILAEDGNYLWME